jgi:P27 family predicted phage terminase small subunit
MSGKPGRSGRRPVPTQLKLLKGDPVAKKRAKREPTPKGKAMCPQWLSPVARAEWRRLAPELRRIGLLTAADTAVFASYCQSYALLREASELLREEGLVIRAISGYEVQHPAVAIQRSAQKAIREAAIELGLSPSARGRLELPGDDSERDPLEQLRIEAEHRHKEQAK